jgi:hypothetical protein
LTSISWRDGRLDLFVGNPTVQWGTSILDTFLTAYLDSLFVFEIKLYYIITYKKQTGQMGTK